MISQTAASGAATSETPLKTNPNLAKSGDCPRTDPIAGAVDKRVDEVFRFVFIFPADQGPLAREEALADGRAVVSYFSFLCAVSATSASLR